MAEAEAVVPQVFTRRASGLVRVMSPYSAFIYNILTMGLIFPWTYVWAPTAFQGSNLVLGILFAFLFELPIALAYTWLATSLPRSGGDYVFQSRVFGGVRVHRRVRVLRRVDPPVGGAVRLADGDARAGADVHRPGRGHQDPRLHQLGNVVRHVRRHHHDQHPERAGVAGPAGQRLQELRPVPVPDVVRDPGIVRVDADPVLHHEPRDRKS